MTLRVRADTRELERLRKKLERTPRLLEQAGEAVGEEFIGLIQDGFRRSRDPFGHSWAAKKHPDGRAILVGRTTRLRRSWHLERSARGVITVASGVVYATFHQTGTRRMVPRKMVPDDALPPDWNAALTETVQDLLSHHFSQR
jgi:phage gpG-like protein